MHHLLYLSIPAAVAPALIILLYFYRQDRLRPEPTGYLVQVFVLGIASTYPLIQLDLYLTRIQFYNMLPKVAYELFVAFIQAGMAEELMKFLVVMIFVYRHRHFDEVTDGILYTITVSLGFAAVENVLYVVGKPFNVALARALTAVPFHAVCSGVMGYYIGRAKFARVKRMERRLLLTGLASAAAIHGLYNFMIYISPVFGALYAIAIVPVVYLTFKRLQWHIGHAYRHDLKHGRVAQIS
ncbi:MAG: PrsW family intramembrane metalloprotease [Candidatus Omnitrophica bacterium]|nr:PrsW family intramembrane metalloprotease [Candidatus Omnitrophota bacterium]MCB9721692.1 PrsW family intramembrane metalloprotease [Candidatus Omnitrophota bacterium]